MKKIIYLLLFSFSFVLLNAQDLKNWKNLTKEQRQAELKKLSPEQRQELMHKAAIEMEIRSLEISVDKQEAFGKLMYEYVTSQKAIKDKFKPDFSKKEMTDSQARKLLEDSFLLGQELLNNRKQFSEKFLKILTPQQVLKLFKHEGKMRQKMMNQKKKQGSNFGNGPMHDELPEE